METMSDFEGSLPNSEMIVPSVSTLSAVHVDPLAESMPRMRKNSWSMAVEIGLACLLKENISFSFTV